MEQCTEICLMKPGSGELRTSDSAKASPWKQDNNLEHTAKTVQEWLWDNSGNVLEWPSQNPDLNPIENLWRDVKMAVYPQSPSNLTA